MQVPAGMFPGDKAPIWEAFRAAADTDLPTAKFDMMDHDAFMERARKAFAVVQTAKPRFTATSSFARASCARKPCDLFSSFSARRAA